MQAGMFTVEMVKQNGRTYTVMYIIHRTQRLWMMEIQVIDLNPSLHKT